MAATASETAPVTVGETADLVACLAVRQVVFIDEQSVPPADEVDGRDADAVHLLACRDGQPIGTARLLIDGRSGTIGRVCVLAAARGSGAGRQLMAAALNSLRARGCTHAELGAQTHAIGFYAGLGFVAEGPDYLDAGIPHRHMVKRL